ncbi:MAG: ribosome maturation factor RimP [Calditrichaeota bacterium]|nr:ribosome maturation factor RimP [Calditrichota bacterium]
MKSELGVENLRQLLLPVIESNNAELVDLELKGRRGNQILRVFVDTDDGITLRHCEKISRDLSDFFDQKDLISGRYRLEVSSPGLDRPLKTPRDFRRNLNRKVRIDFVNRDGENLRLEGKIKLAEEKMIFIEAENRDIAVPLDQIKLAKILPLW